MEAPVIIENSAFDLQKFELISAQGGFNVEFEIEWRSEDNTHEVVGGRGNNPAWLVVKSVEEGKIQWEKEIFVDQEAIEPGRVSMYCNPFIQGSCDRIEYDLRFKLEVPTKSTGNLGYKCVWKEKVIFNNHVTIAGEFILLSPKVESS